MILLIIGMSFWLFASLTHTNNKYVCFFDNLSVFWRGRIQVRKLCMVLIKNIRAGVGHRSIWARLRKTWVSPFSKFSLAVFRPTSKNIKKNPRNVRLGPSERWIFLVFYDILYDHIDSLFIFLILIWKTVFRCLAHLTNTGR